MKTIIIRHKRRKDGCEYVDELQLDVCDEVAAAVISARGYINKVRHPYGMKLKEIVRTSEELQGAESAGVPFIEIGDDPGEDSYDVR